ncbi:FAD-dependent oxidoreductase [Paracoccus beibuensis]|uniref:FAD-dependent oxidoreductase n=1 Tax=Paracoccus beibuensis TaxID=547602 RepID=UPI00223EBFDB|nr:FAD-dependent oxidoreductase [Paracoccus beibuensis]
MVTPTVSGVRVGGTVDMAGLDAAPDLRRSKINVRRVQTTLPNPRCENFTEWMEHRPAFPDTVPVMSASARTRGVFHVAGCGHLGVTYVATDARFMGNLITSVTPPLDISSYRPDRF